MPHSLLIYLVQKVTCAKYVKYILLEAFFFKFRVDSAPNCHDDSV